MPSPTPDPSATTRPARPVHRAHWAPWRRAEARRGVGTMAVLFTLYCALVLATRLLCRDDAGYESFWPANAVLLVALLVLRPRQAFGLLAICFVADVTVLRFGAPIDAEAVLASVLNVAIALIAAPLTRRFCGATTDLTHPHRFAMFVPIALGAASIEALVGILVETYVLADPADPFADWMQWVMCDALGLIIATPAVIALVRRRIASDAAASPRVVGALVALSVALALVSFLLPGTPLFLLLFPALVLVAFCASAVTGLLVVLVVSVIVSAFTAHDLGPIARLSPDGHLMRVAFIQPFLFALLLVVVPTSNAVGAKRRYMRRLSGLQARMAETAARDTLTPADSRLHFEASLRALIARGGHGALLLIDIDHFKRVNDGFGHQTGDLVLVEFARRLIEAAGMHQGRVGRLGGDEFALCLAVRLPRDALDLFCRGVIARLRQPYRIGTEDHVFTASIGATPIEAGPARMEEVMRRADHALYAAKAAGRDGHAIADRIEAAEPALLS
ncbi:diguanylate cyclase, partial [Endobacter medicaginis]|nr:diguanylate cyclase [Endobacter medicaginis]